MIVFSLPLLLNLLTVITTATTTTCPTGFTALTTGKCVKFSNGSVANHVNAEANCETIGGRLTSITNAIDNSALLQLSNGAIWLGMKCGDATNCFWTDGSVISYNNFLSGQPSSDIGSCVMMTSKGKWMSSDCDGFYLGYVCEADAIVDKCSGASYTTSDQGTLTSPNFPGTYMGTSGTPCYYLITTSFATQAVVQFPILALDENSTISLYNSEQSTTPLITFDSKNTGSSTWYYSDTNVLKIAFNKCSGDSCDTKSLHLWEIYYRASNLLPTTTQPTTTNGCNAGVLQTPGVISSPNYPALYPNDLDCAYYLNAPDGYVIQLIFNSLDTEKCCDIIVIHDGLTTEIGRLSGYYEPNTQRFVSSSNSMLITFSTDSNGQKSGFQATFSFLKK